MKTLAAYTAPDGMYPPFFNATLLDDGETVRITVRSAPTVREGVHVCAHAHEAGPGRCTPGGPTCNNYCNMAPQKGPMQDSPLPAIHTHCGSTASIDIPVGEFWVLWRTAMTAIAKEVFVEGEVTKHHSHVTRHSDASSYDEICVNCGATDISGGGWGKLAQPCQKSVLR